MSDQQSKLRTLRKEKKLSQKELAEKCDCSHVTISGIERGAKEPSKKLATRIAEFFEHDITVMELLFGE